jgi:hypothetical protein
MDRLARPVTNAAALFDYQFPVERRLLFLSNRHAGSGVRMGAVVGILDSTFSKRIIYPKPVPG